MVGAPKTGYARLAGPDIFGIAMHGKLSAVGSANSGASGDIIFRVAFGSDAAAARKLRVSRMTIWRWRHDRAPLPRWVVEALPNLIQNKVAEAHLAQTELGYFLALPAKPPRKLSGCCAYHVRSKDGKS
jgi:hypothetical protein